MYKQSIQDIQLVIIPLDGTIFNLNRYRYNYTHHFCESHHLDYSLDDFYHHLCNMYEMYNDFINCTNGANGVLKECLSML